ncbi:ferredoxin [Bacteroidia bacterium]|nr:ferredoxin [Bacteroidia bacterium]
MKFSLLRGLRVFIALLIFLPLLFYFCDFLDIVPNGLKELATIQLVPAVLAGSLVILLILFLLTLLFGRIYCSTICPLGVLQDIVSRFSGRGQKNKKGKKKHIFKYAKPQNYLRYGLLSICVILPVLGIVTPLLLLDPYSNWGRIATNLLRPVGMLINNLIASIATKSGNFSFYHVSIETVTTISLIAGIIALLVVGIMSFLRGRLYCNTICPVGSLLGLVSRYSLFKVVMDENRCTKCTLCERACKSQCIDSKSIKIDSSRCVSCYNCLSRCKHGAIGYRFSWKNQKQKNPDVEINDVQQSILTERDTRRKSRRAFMATGTAVVATIPFIPAWAQASEIDESKLTPVTPPGSKSLKHFKEKCTACHLCVTHCPQQILKPAGLSFGFGYLLKPHMVYEKAYCNYECDICSKVCPNGAILPVGEKKKTTQVGIAKFVQERCVVFNDETDCGACSEHCPTQAVRMLPYKDGLRLPHVTPELCVGCGGCEYICPVRPVRAINVIANEVHQVSKKPEEEEIEQIKVDDFGF